MFTYTLFNHLYTQYCKPLGIQLLVGMLMESEERDRERKREEIKRESKDKDNDVSNYRLIPPVGPFLEGLGAHGKNEAAENGSHVFL